MSITDPTVMRALAHPVRMALIELFGVHPTLTATQASEALGESPANCAFHLRTLAKYGFIEEAGGGRGRERPWKASDQVAPHPPPVVRPRLRAGAGGGGRARAGLVRPLVRPDQGGVREPAVVPGVGGRGRIVADPGLPHAGGAAGGAGRDQRDRRRHLDERRVDPSQRRPARCRWRSSTSPTPGTTWPRSCRADDDDDDGAPGNACRHAGNSDRKANLGQSQDIS